MKKKKRNKTNWRSFLPYVLLTITGAVLFKVGADAAYAQRGYAAVGGEVFALFLPVFFWVVSQTVKDFMR